VRAGRVRWRVGGAGLKDGPHGQHHLRRRARSRQSLGDRLRQRLVPSYACQANS
jgi:hypothetical protein